MIAEVFRIFADAFADETIGIAAQLATIPTDAAETAPKAPVRIRDVTRHPEVAAGIIGPDWPVLDLDQDGPAAWQASTGLLTRHAVFTLRVVYGTRDPDFGQAVSDGLRVIWASVLTVRALMRPAQAALRLRNSVEVVRLETETPVQAGPIAESLEDGMLTAAALVTVLIKDRLAES